MTKTVNQLLIEIAARSKMERIGERKDERGNDFIDFRFDTQNICGDFTIIHIPMPFESESSARLKLFEEMKSWGGL